MQQQEAHEWDSYFTVKPTSADVLTEKWNMHYFYVPRTKGMPDWDIIPAIEMTNHILPDNGELTGDVAADDDLKVSYKMAWDTENLYLRVEVEDDHFVTSPQLWDKAQSENALWLHDGALEVYIDTAADGRSNAEKTFDDDDYRYDFAIAKDLQPGAATVNRFRAVYHQLADGIHMPTKEEAAEKVIADFAITDRGYCYTIMFGQRYIEPLALEVGFTSGFAIYLHDKDDGALGYCSKGMSLASVPGARCDYKPHLWPLMILSGKTALE
ncbi:MAG: sugar-binding protein [Puniceicoccales bacterium]